MPLVEFDEFLQRWNCHRHTKSRYGRANCFGSQVLREVSERSIPSPPDFAGRGLKKVGVDASMEASPTIACQQVFMLKLFT